MFKAWDLLCSARLNTRIFVSGGGWRDRDRIYLLCIELWGSLLKYIHEKSTAGRDLEQQIKAALQSGPWGYSSMKVLFNG